MDIVLATGNPGKKALYGAAFAEFGLSVRGLNDLGRPIAEVEENGATPEANALLKARAPWLPGLVAFGDDAGLEIDALGGEPGVQTRRWGGRFTDEISDDDWLDYLLSRMEGVPLPRRTARFVSGLALIAPDGTEGTLRVLTPFIIAERRMRPMTRGFPLSAVAIIPGAADDGSPDAPGYVGVRASRVVGELRRWRFFQSVCIGACAEAQNG